MIDTQRVRREFIRWILLIALNNARASGGASENLLLQIVQGEYGDATAIEIRGELDYLEARNLVSIDRRPDGRWVADIGRYGIDVVEYSVEVDPGIARPKKYWPGG